MAESLADLLIVETSRRNTDLVADIVSKKPELFGELMEIYLRNEEPVSRRAAWVADTCSEKMPELMEPWLKKLAETLPSFDHDALKRHSLRILARSPLPEELTGYLINLCFTWLTVSSEAVAVKYYCMEILYRLSQDEPEIKKELADSIEWRLSEETPGFRVQARKILKKLSKELRDLR